MNKDRKMLAVFAFTAIISAVLLSACSTSSHILMGQARAPTKAADVKLYFAPPRKFEQIALLNSDSNGSFRFSAQGKVDAAINRMKKEAAKLGANGILFGSLGESGSVTVASGAGTVSGNTYSGSAVGVTAGGLIKNVSGTAIFVTEP